MMRLFGLCVSGTYALAACMGVAEPRPADAVAWLAGCIEIVQQDSSVAGEMDSNCVADAFDLCEQGRRYEARGPCIDRVVSNLNQRTGVLIAEKPDVSGLTGFAPRAFESYWTTALNTDNSETCATHKLPGRLCDAFTAMQRWTSARTAWRIWRRSTE